MSIYKKIFEVMNKSKGLEKDMNVANQYNAVSEKAMLNTIKPLIKNAGLIIFPCNTEINQVQNGNKSITQVKVTYKIVDTESGESIETVGIGNGADSQDKGAGKAFTYAYKAMLSKTFMLFSGEDTDNQHSDQITSEQLIETIKDILPKKGLTVKDIEGKMQCDLLKMDIGTLNTVINRLYATPDKTEG